MPTLTYLGESFDCATAIKGSNYIHLLDEAGCMIAAFDAITDFSGFKLTNGSYTSPTADHDCYLAVLRDDGTIGRGGHKCSDIPMSAADLSALPTVDATAAGNDMDVIFKSGAHLAVYKTGSETLGTPSAAGKTSLKYATILSYATSTTRGMQIAFISGSNLICVRRLYNGEISAWGALYTENNKPTAEDVVGAAKIETGSYVGTGTCGVNHPTEITFSFVPKMVWVWAHTDSPIGRINGGYTIPCHDLTEEYSDAYYLNASNKWHNKLVGNTLSFYYGEEVEDEDTGKITYPYSSVDAQLNVSGSTYYYMAIG